MVKWYYKLTLSTKRKAFKMKMFSLNKTQFKIISKMYIRNQNSMTLTNSVEIDQAHALLDKLPNSFVLNRMSHLEYSFHIKDLSLFSDLLKYNSKHLEG